jgi:ABC-type Zn uptake system ZnuABC Zn-binding protein ZnuA
VSLTRLAPLLLVGVLLACGTDETPPEEALGDAGDADETVEGDDADEATEEPHLRIVATVAPITDLVAWVGGDRVEATSLVPPGADSHTYEPRPGDVRTLSDADAYLGIGLDLNPGALALAEENLDDDRVIRLGERFLDDDALVFDHSHDDGHSHGDDGHSHDEDGGHSHDEDGGHSHDDADGGQEPGPNPHVWTGLGQAATLLDGIATTLSELDPDGEETYTANAADARAELEELDAQIRDAAATIPSEQRTLVVYHDAWSYFAEDYGLEMVTAVQPSDFSEPSAGDVRDIIDLLREEDVPAVFGSEVFPSDVLDAISEETGATYVGDLADDVLPGEPGDEEHSYLGLMRRNATLIVEGLGGDASGLTEAA